VESEKSIEKEGAQEKPNQELKELKDEKKLVKNRRKLVKMKKKRKKKKIRKKKIKITARKLDCLHNRPVRFNKMLSSIISNSIR
jgi:hypothetical protein